MTYELRIHPDVQKDILGLIDKSDIPEDWRLARNEVKPAMALALKLIASLREDPRQGEPMAGRVNARVLQGARRLKFDPRDPPPKDRRGRPRPRLRLVWRNLPDEAAVEIVSVLAVGHRFGSAPYRRATGRHKDIEPAAS
jgi:hypothetical protein